MLDGPPGPTRKDSTMALQAMNLYAEIIALGHSWRALASEHLEAAGTVEGWKELDDSAPRDMFDTVLTTGRTIAGCLTTLADEMDKIATSWRRDQAMAAEPSGDHDQAGVTPVQTSEISWLTLQEEIQDALERANSTGHDEAALVATHAVRRYIERR